MDKACPPQGCAIDPLGQTQDCTAYSNGPKPFYDWDLASGGVLLPTSRIDLGIKSPSGTIVLTQNAGTSGGPDVETHIQDNATGLGMKLVSMRIYAKLHPGSTNVDFYTLWGVDSTKPEYTIPNANPGTLKRVVGSRWYDLYWQDCRNGNCHTLAEEIWDDGLGSLILVQSN
jgi:hypothetical protein